MQREVQMMADFHVEVNWDELEREYRAGQIPIAALARAHGISDHTIAARARKEGWTRSLKEQVAVRRMGLDMAEALYPLDTSRMNMTDRENIAIEVAAQRGQNIVSGHRADIKKLRNLADQMTDGITRLFMAAALGEEEDQGPVRPGDSLLLGKVQGLVDGLEKLAKTMETLIKLERQAYSLDDSNKPVDFDALRKTVEEAKSELARRGLTPRPPIINGSARTI